MYPVFQCAAVDMVERQMLELAVLSVVLNSTRRAVVILNVQMFQTTLNQQQIELTLVSSP